MRHEDLGTTIAQFLHFYSIYINFNTYVIQPCYPGDYSHGPIMIRHLLVNAEDKLLIIDPLNQNNNVGKSSFNIEEIKQCFQEA
jgi:DNA polymerase sigma